MEPASEGAAGNAHCITAAPSAASNAAVDKIVNRFHSLRSSAGQSRGARAEINIIAAGPNAQTGNKKPGKTMVEAPKVNFRYGEHPQ
jgi:hypothetical protein